ncbi:nucleophile aminohydrolase [Pelagophyceae sp. CCMP2097]|nr:nucleophile aminohydrolase [Pelagophyceae sp. CCMP2097]
MGRFALWLACAAAALGGASGNFSGDGRLLQVEYAMRAAARGGLVVGVAAAGGCVLAAVLDDADAADDGKLARVAPHLGLGTAGLVGDARHLARRARAAAVDHWLDFGERVDARHLADAVADFAAQASGCALDAPAYATARPLGVAALLGGVDDDGAAALFSINAAGVVKRCRAAAVGSGADAALDCLRSELAALTAAPPASEQGDDHGDGPAPTWTVDEAVRMVARVILAHDDREAAAAAAATAGPSAKAKPRRPLAPRVLFAIVDAAPHTAAPDAAQLQPYDDGWASSQPGAARYRALPQHHVQELIRR